VPLQVRLMRLLQRAAAPVQGQAWTTRRGARAIH
jgi:hypothetical protein